MGSTAVSGRPRPVPARGRRRGIRCVRPVASPRACGAADLARPGLRGDSRRSPPVVSSRRRDHQPGDPAGGRAMSITGGFDVCIEISETLLGANLEPALLALLPSNHEVVLDLTLPGEDGVDHPARLHLFVSELNTLARTGNDARFDLDIGILESALAVTGPRADHAGGLFGSILVRGVPVTLASPTRANPTSRRTTAPMVD